MSKSQNVAASQQRQQQF